ncbi:hypothetical protein F2Q69_00061441 [Brassica cretica]|uniref:Uncharacterized protein n=1 Tax=Brassica cretica TaxID=69181 RepID=A0A8S9RDW9_BRACR|nr:hypothetical protein F2Q69_00061441 [Brassica cretica]
MTESSLVSPFHNRSEHFGKFLCRFFFIWFQSDGSHLPLGYVFCVFYKNQGLIYMFFRSGSDFGRHMECLLGSLLKYNALEDFQKVFQTTSKKSSRRSSDGVFFHIKLSLSLSL